jgi:pimeloyl-ACP methyl ester carboxylesterase
MTTIEPYRPRREAQSREWRLRGGLHHTWCWPGTQAITPERPLLVLLHGWMDVGASFQFVADALDERRHVIALDWRGYGRTHTPPSDSYWFPDYLGDLDALLDEVQPQGRVDLLGHSMGGNVAMMYAGVRPGRIRRLINLEGFGMPATRPQDAPLRMRRWLDELKSSMTMRDYASQADVAQRLRENHPRLRPDRARWLAAHWAQPRADGRWHVAGDPAHKRINPVLSRRDETLEIWRAIEAPLLWVEGRQTDMAKWWGTRYPRSDFDERLATVRNVTQHVIDDCAHMLHMDQPEALARVIDHFLIDGFLRDGSGSSV